MAGRRHDAFIAAALAWTLMAASVVCLCGAARVAPPTSVAPATASGDGHACCDGHPEQQPLPSCPHCDHSELSTADVTRPAALVPNGGSFALVRCRPVPVPFRLAFSGPIYVEALGPPFAPDEAHVVLRL